MPIILPHGLNSQEIRVLQEYRRLNGETLNLDQLKAIKHPGSGGGEAPAVSLVAKGFLTGNGDGFTLTQQAKDFLAIDAKPEFEGAGGAGSDAEDAEEA